MWARRMLADMGAPQTMPTTLYEDNTSTITLTTGHGNHERQKHIDVRHHFIKDEVNKGTIRLVHINTKLQLADQHTKPQGEEQQCLLGDAIMGIQELPVELSEKIVKLD